MNEYYPKNVERLEFESMRAKVDDLQRQIDYVDTKLRSKLDYLLKEVQKLKVLADLNPESHKGL